MIFFPFFIFAQITDIDPDHYLYDRVILATEKNIFEIENKKFNPEKFITLEILENALSKTQCKKYSLKNQPKNIFLHKSEIIIELYEILKQKNTEFPFDKNFIYFRDIPTNSPYLEAAQALTSLDILKNNNGFFGTPDEPDPFVTQIELLELLSKTFDFNCGLNLDFDNDGIKNSDDFCPQIPAKNSSNGCPKIPKKNFSKKHTGIPVFLNLQNNFKYKQLTEIKLHDEIFGAIYDPKTKKIFSKSNKLKVKN